MTVVLELRIICGVRPVNMIQFCKSGSARQASELIDFILNCELKQVSVCELVELVGVCYEPGLGRMGSFIIIYSVFGHFDSVYVEYAAVRAAWQEPRTVFNSVLVRRRGTC